MAHPLIERLFQKRGVKPDDLTSEEKETFSRWQRILTEDKITPEKIAEFCDIQKGEIEKKFEDLGNSSQKNDRLILLHTVYTKIGKMIRSTGAERESLEQHLNQMLDTD
jgi:hypothetical protein